MSFLHKCKNQKFKLPKIKKKTQKNVDSLLNSENLSYYNNSPNSIDRVEHNYQFIQLIFFCLLRKSYKNFIVLVSPSFTNYDKKSFDCTDITFKTEISIKSKFIFFQEIIFFDTTEEIMVKELKRISKRDERFIIINIGYQDHANIMILDTLNVEAYHFEPHGANSSYNINGYNRGKITNFLKKVFPKITVFWPDQYLPPDGFQTLDVRDSIYVETKKKSDSDGYCFYWCIYFINMVIKFPEIPIPELVEKIIHSVNSKKPNKNFRKLIREYSNKMEVRAHKEYSDVFSKKYKKSHKKKWHKIIASLRPRRMIGRYINEFSYKK